MSRRAGLVLDDEARRDWLRLSRSEGVGPRTFQGLIDRFGTPRAALEALPALARARGRNVVVPSDADIEREMTRAARLGIRLVASCEGDYPDLLGEIDGAPPVLGIRGNPDVLHRPAIGIVGARNASAIGRKMASKLAEGLSAAGHVVVSGLARGIDTEAHRASMEGGTVAVLAGGLDRPYPPENAALLDEIAEKGAAISEMPLGLSPRGRDFPRRNRLISGLSVAVVVVEAARRSGSLITARMAGEQGREVFAVPGSPLDPRCEGSNDLLRDGASIATSAEDILAVLKPMAGKGPRAPTLFREKPAAKDIDLFADWDPVAGGALWEEAAEPDEREEADFASVSAETRLTALLSVDPVEIDLLTRLSGLPARIVQVTLSELELAGSVTRYPGNRVARAVE